MAGRKVSSVTAQITPSSGVAKTLWQATAPANFGLEVDPPAVGFDGTSTTAAKATIDVVKGATGGTGSSLTPTRVSGVTGAVQGTTKENFSAEPTGGATVYSEKWHTQGNWRYPRGKITLDPGETLAIRVTVPAAVPCSVSGDWEE